MTRPTGIRLGKSLAPKFDRRTLQLDNYVDLARVPMMPNRQDYFLRGPKDWGYLGNDSVGCCTKSGLGHLHQAWGVNATGRIIDITTAAVLAGYSRISGYDPNRPETDRGAYCIDALNDERKIGMADSSGKVHKILAYARVNPLHHAMVRFAALLGGGLYIGATLHSGIWGAKVWEAPKPGETLEGGHAMCVGIIGDRVVPIGWRVAQETSWGWWDVEVDEAYCVLSVDALDESGRNVAGFNRERLLADLELVSQ